MISFKDETKNIIGRLQAIGNLTGARDHFFKLNEGNPGDGVCALYDNPKSNLRLYCIRYGTQIIVLGDGGHKPKVIRTLQEESKLKDANYFLRLLSNEITQRIRDREITYRNDGLEFEGELEFDI